MTNGCGLVDQMRWIGATGVNRRCCFWVNWRRRKPEAPHGDSLDPARSPDGIPQKPSTARYSHSREDRFSSIRLGCATPQAEKWAIAAAAQRFPGFPCGEFLLFDFRRRGSEKKKVCPVVKKIPAKLSNVCFYFFERQNSRPPRRPSRSPPPLLPPPANCPSVV